MDEAVGVRFDPRVKELSPGRSLAIIEDGHVVLLAGHDCSFAA